ncbi:MAG: MATE family efflux transporter [Mediterranea massiliensis]|nr:MATE family efflux transporter [Mediterranea massiliensis]
MKHHTVEDNYTMLTQAPVPRLIVKMAIPTIISMLVTALYNLADTFFVSQINTQATAAVGISFSAMAVIQSLGFFFGHGSGNYMARELGAQRRKEATKMAATGFYLAFLLGVLLALLGYFFITPLSTLLGSTPTILPYTEQYLGIVLLNAPFFSASLALNNQIRLQGNAVYSMVGIVSGAVINVLLDPVFIFLFDWGITGAAIATVVGQLCSFFLLLYMTFRGDTLPVHPKDFSPTWKNIKEIIHGGAPSLTRQSLASLATILMNVAAGAYGDAAIAGMTIVSRIGFFLQSVIIGFGQGFQPVCGFNYGAQQFDRVLQGFWFCCKVAFAYLLFCAITGITLAEEVVGLFRDDAEVIAVGAAALRWQLVAFPLSAWTTISNMMLQTIRKSVRATVLSSARQGLFFIPLIFILPRFLGLQGVEMCQATSDILTFFLAIPLTYGVLKEMKAHVQ